MSYKAVSTRLYQVPIRKQNKVLYKQVGKYVTFSSSLGPEGPSRELWLYRVRAWEVTSVLSASVRPCGLQPAGILCPWDSPGKDPGVGCHALLQGIFLTQGSNLPTLHLLHCQAGPSPLAPSGKTVVLHTHHELENIGCGRQS